MQSWIEQLRPNCGPLSDAAVRFASEQGFAEDPPRGAPALRRLLQAIAKHSDQPDEVPEEPFVEGAGSFLGVVLAERFGNGRHVCHGDNHGLALGQHGYFDPFACVADTLAAEEQTKCLLDGISAAEAEARATSHAARVTAQLSQALCALNAGVTIAQRIESRLWVHINDDTTEVDIKGLLSVTQGEGDALTSEIIGRFAKVLCGDAGSSLHAWQEARLRLLPRIIGPSWRARMATLDNHPNVALLPLSDELEVALVLQYSGRARYVRNDELAAWQITGETALLEACNHLQRVPLKLHREQADRLVCLRTGDGYDSARLLLPDVQRVLRDEVGSDIALAIPHRDSLLACARHDEKQVQALQARAQHEALVAPHAVSAKVWTLSERGQLMRLIV